MGLLYLELASLWEAAGPSNGDGGGETKNSALRKTGRKRMSAIEHYG
jgi:hypothetical protein